MKRVEEVVFYAVICATIGSRVFAQPQACLLHESAKILASDGSAGDHLGESAASSGVTTVIGAPRADGDVGSAYVFQRTAGGGPGWVQLTKLIPPTGSTGERFAGNQAVAIDGDTIVIGAAGNDNENGSDAGAAYVFERGFGGPDNWGMAARLLAADGQAGDSFGISVSISGQTIVIAARWDDDQAPNAGSAYVFEKGPGWSSGSANQVAKLLVSDGAAGDSFGNAVGVSGDIVVIGAPLTQSSEGSAYVFVRPIAGWNSLPSPQFEAVRLSETDGTPDDDEFGQAVAISNNTIVVGANHQDFNGAQSGAAYLYERDAGGPSNWGLVGRLVASDGQAVEIFGASVAIDEDLVLVGAPQSSATNTFSGSAYLFIRPAGGWASLVCPIHENAKLTASDQGPFGDFLGFVSISGNLAIIGASGVDDNGDYSGATYEFLMADTDGDATGDTCDLDDDNDGLTDADEAIYGTDPLIPDTDDDGLSDGDEFHTYLTDPLDADSDGDGLSDSTEIANQQFGCPDPLVFDTDADGLSDGFEIGLGLDACNDADFDVDGLMDVQELLDFGTNPLIPDTDGDGLFDGTEVDMSAGTGCPNPLIADSDGDGLSDGAEVALGTNPCLSDTDGDTIPDGVDPLPTVPGVTSSYIQEDLLALCAYLDGLALENFAAPNNNARQGRRNAMCNKLHAAASAVASGDFEEAYDQLESLLQKLDDQPQPPDWMVHIAPQDAKTEVREDIELLMFLISFEL